MTNSSDQFPQMEIEVNQDYLIEYPLKHAPNEQGYSHNIASIVLGIDNKYYLVTACQKRPHCIHKDCSTIKIPLVQEQIEQMIASGLMPRLANRQN